MSLPQEMYSVKSVQAIDRAAITSGIPGYTLMTRAAKAAFAHARTQFPQAKRWQVICGSGNNAGDGYVLARLAAEDGMLVSVLAISSPEALHGDAERAYGDFAGSGGVVLPWAGSLDHAADLLIDALFGSGLCRAIDGVYADAIREINAHPAPVMALDLPSGIHGDDGRTQGIAVRAQLTVTFVGVKPGLFLADGPRCSGQVEFADLDIPPPCRDGEEPIMRRVLASLTTANLRKRARDSHKGMFGHVLVVGGGPGMPGAALLAGQAALRCGAGRVTVATHPDHAATIAAARPELMCQGIANAGELAPLVETATVVVLGPGLGRGQWSGELFDAVIDTGHSLVVDADALYWLAQRSIRNEPGQNREWILTPHPGEAAFLLGSDSATVQQDRLAAARAIQQKFGGVVVLKGAGTLIDGGRGAPHICTTGNPGMASPGMGDVLAGVIGALIAQNLHKEAELAACIAVDLHARAGDLAAAQGERGMLAGDLLPHLRQLVNP